MDNGWEKYQSLVLDKLGNLEKFNAEIKAELVTLSNRIISLEKDQVKNTANIMYHIKRTDIAEQKIEIVEQRLENEVRELRQAIYDMQVTIQKDMESTRKAVEGWKANLSLLGWLFSALTIIIGMLLRFYSF